MRKKHIISILLFQSFSSFNSFSSYSFQTLIFSCSVTFSLPSFPRIQGISLKVRGTLYKSYERNVLTYGAECWALKIEGERRLKTTEMRMLQMICGKTLKDKMNNEKIREMTGVVRLEEFLREKNCDSWDMWRE